MGESRDRDRAEKYMSEFLDGFSSLCESEIRDAAIRLSYISAAKKTSSYLLEQARAAVANSADDAAVIWQQFAEKACTLRNQTMAASRQKLSEIGVQLSKWIKEEGKQLYELVKHYANKLYPCVGVEQLTPQMEAKIFENIVEASGRTNPKVNLFSKITLSVVIVVLLAQLSYMIYRVFRAEKPLYELAEEAVSFGAGLVGGYLGTKLSVSLVLTFATSASAGPIGVIAAVVGGIVGGILASFGATHLFRLVYQLIFPHSEPGPGPPKLDLKQIYGAPDLGCEVLFGAPKLDLQDISGPPKLGLEVLHGHQI